MGYVPPPAKLTEKKTTVTQLKLKLVAWSPKYCAVPSIPWKANVWMDCVYPYDSPCFCCLQDAKSSNQFLWNVQSIIELFYLHNADTWLDWTGRIFSHCEDTAEMWQTDHLNCISSISKQLLASKRCSQSGNSSKPLVWTVYFIGFTKYFLVS